MPEKMGFCSLVFFKANVQNGGLSFLGRRGSASLSNHKGRKSIVTLLKKNPAETSEFNKTQYFAARPI